MDHREVGRYWEGNAATWTKLVRGGWDVCRDAQNTPAFMAILPDIAGKTGLDVGCGEGHNTRLLAARGARMFAVDVSPTFVRAAADAGGGIRHALASALELPFPSGRFDFCTSFMCLQDVPHPRPALAEIYRVLHTDGFLQFSILHPCFAPPYRRLLRTAEGTTYAIEIGRYFETGGGRIDRWTFSAAPAEAKVGLKPFEVPIFHYTISDWLNCLIEVGFVLDRVAEPRADEETARRVPTLEDTRVAPFFLHVRCRKPANLR
jgi:SAM-dependent methyltransferase